MAPPPARPLLTASLIVKDEEAALPRCLAALQDVVDEIVVYDTGSTDRTVEVAQAAGAVVHRGAWHDDFARARNEALAHCAGRWVLVVDADEELRVEDVAAFRRGLARSAVDAYTVRIDNVEDHGGSVTFTHDAIRLFRRTRFAFEGRVHEHVVLRSDRQPQIAAADLSILHHGYRLDVVAAKDKVERNVRLARAAWEADQGNVLARIELARSLSNTAAVEEALTHLRVLRELGGTPRDTALALGVKVLVHGGQLEEALAWAEEIRRDGQPTLQSAKQHADLLYRLGRLEEALEVLETAPAPDEDAGVHGTHESAAVLEVMRGRLLHALGREDEAAAVLLAVADESPVAAWPLLLRLLDATGDLRPAVPPFLAGVAATGQERASGILAELSRGATDVANAFFQVLAADEDGLRYALAWVVTNAERLPLDDAVEWSAVARAAGLLGSCPLLAQMDAFTLPPMQRLMAAATVAGRFGDDRGRHALQRSAAGLADDEVPDALYVISELAPEALGDLVAGYVTSQRRALVAARALEALGAPAQAVGVLAYALEECAADAASTSAIDEALARLELVA